MKRRDLTTKDLDRIGIKALTALRATDDEIDNIVASEVLFEPVRAAMRLRSDRPSAGSSHFRFGPYALAWSMAVASLLVAAIIGVLAFIGQYDYSSRQAAENLSEQVLPVELPAVQEASPVVVYKEPSSPTVVAASFGRQTAHRSRRPARPNTQRRPEPISIEDVGEFQALTYTGDASEIGDAAQIVRVELPRSSLFALGVDLPIENQNTTKIKADLLIGEDGVMRAVRVVN
jgi:hypothetical protein